MNTNRSVPRSKGRRPLRRGRNARRLNLQGMGLPSTVHVVDDAANGNIGNPMKRNVKLRWTLDYQFNGAITPTYAQMRLNSPYDPWVPVTITDSANEFDTYAAIYDEYLVHHVDVAVTFCNGQGTNTRAFVNISNNDISGYSYADAEMLPKTKRTIIGQNAGPAKAFMKWKNVSLSALIGQRDLDADPTEYSATTTNPADPLYLTVGVQSTSGTSVALDCTFEIVFHCWFKSKKNLATPASVRLAKYKSAEKTKALEKGLNQSEKIDWKPMPSSQPLELPIPAPTTQAFELLRAQLEELQDKLEALEFN